MQLQLYNCNITLTDYYICKLVDFKAFIFPLVAVPCRQRLKQMREVYLSVAEMSPTSPQGGQGGAPGSESFDAEDPFYDRFPWFRVFAR